MKNNKGAEAPIETFKAKISQFPLTFQSENYFAGRFVKEDTFSTFMATGKFDISNYSAGIFYKVQGRWITHPKYGNQFEIVNMYIESPSDMDADGFEAFLVGMVKGIGPVTAHEIVLYFNKDIKKLVDVFDNSPLKLLNVRGIGESTLESVVNSWKNAKPAMEVMAFCGKYGISTNLSQKMFKVFGDKTIEILKQNPYSVLGKVDRAGFKTIDELAMKMGFEPTFPERIIASIVYTIDESCQKNGNMAVTEEELMDNTGMLLGDEVSNKAIRNAVETAIINEQIIVGDTISRNNKEPVKSYYHPRYYRMEEQIANHLDRITSDKSSRLLNFDGNILIEETLEESVLNEKQRNHIRNIFRHKVTVLTGGPGTGKTRTLQTIVDIFEKLGITYSLCAPTGRASKKMSEATDKPASTIHRLLSFRPDKGFQFNEERPLAAEVIVVDEGSMEGSYLTNAIVCAIQTHAHLLLIGDINQLPSVEPGNVLNDIIEYCPNIYITRLTDIYRQDEKSHIVDNAYKINHGKMPFLSNSLSDTKDFFFVELDEPVDITNKVISTAVESIKRPPFNFNPYADVQILAPMYKGSVGIDVLNKKLQAELNPPSPDKQEIKIGDNIYRVGDRVMQTKNNYDLNEDGVFNGDMGTITFIDPIKKVVDISYDGEIVTYSSMEYLFDITLGYCISIHKSQGAEYPVVIIPIHSSQYIMLTRNLLYTAITRAKKLVIIIGQKKAVGMAISNNKIQDRRTGLPLFFEKIKEKGQSSENTI